MSVSYRCQRQCRFIGKPKPKLMKAVDEQVLRDVWLFLAPKSVNRLPFSRHSIELPFTNIGYELQFNQRTIQTIFLNTAFTSTRRYIGMKERFEVLRHGSIGDWLTF